MNLINMSVNCHNNVFMNKKSVSNFVNKNLITNYQYNNDSVDFSQKQTNISFKELPSVSYEEVQSWGKNYLKKHKLKSIFPGNRYKRIVNRVLNCDGVKNDSACRSLIYWLYSNNDYILEDLHEEDVFADCNIPDIISERIQRYLPEYRQKRAKEYQEFFYILKNNPRLLNIATENKKGKYLLPKALESWDISFLNSKLRETLQIPNLFNISTNVDAIKDLLAGKVEQREFDKSGVSDNMLSKDLDNYVCKYHKKVFGYKLEESMDIFRDHIKHDCKKAPNYKYFFHLLMNDDYSNILYRDFSLVRAIPDALYWHFDDIEDVKDLKKFLDILNNNDRLLSIITNKNDYNKFEHSILSDFLLKNSSIDKIGLVSADLKKLIKHSEILYDPKYEYHIKSIFYHNADFRSGRKVDEFKKLYKDLMKKLDELESNSKKK